MDYYGIHHTEGTWCLKTDAPFHIVEEAVTDADAYKDLIEGGKHNLDWWSNIVKYITDLDYEVEDVDMYFICANE